MRLKLVLRFVAAVVVIALFAGFSDDAVAEDKDNGKGAVAAGDVKPRYGDKLFYIGNLGNSSKRAERVAKLEGEINALLQSVPGIEEVLVQPFFGKGYEILFTVEYKIGENKGKKPCNVKLFYMHDVTSDSARKDGQEDRDVWYASKPNINITSRANYYYNSQGLNIIVYEDAN